MSKIEGIVFYAWAIGNYLHQKEPDMGLLDWFKKLGSWVKKAIVVVQEVVPNEILAAAVAWVKVTANTQLDNTQKRELVVAQLHSRFPGVSESILRLAVELAVRLVKKELGKL